MFDISIISKLFSLKDRMQTIIATSPTFKDIAKHINDPEIINTLEQIAESTFPGIKRELRLVAGAVTTFDTDHTKWLQGALNAVVEPSPNLVVDGLYGPSTVDAVKKFQQQVGVVPDGWVGDITSAAIQGLVAKKVQVT